MPHILLETTSDLPENANVPDILEALVHTLAAQELVSPAAVKAYHSLRSQWHVGEGHPAGIAHCTVKVLSGRPPEWRSTVADAMFLTLQEHFAESLAANEVGISLELREMDRASYRK